MPGTADYVLGDTDEEALSHLLGHVQLASAQVLLSRAAFQLVRAPPALLLGVILSAAGHSIYCS